MGPKETGSKYGELRGRMMDAAATRARIGPKTAKRLRGKPLPLTKTSTSCSVKTKHKGNTSLDAITADYRNN